MTLHFEPFWGPFWVPKWPSFFLQTILFFAPFFTSVRYRFWKPNGSPEQPFWEPKAPKIGAWSWVRIFLWFGFHFFRFVTCSFIVFYVFFTRCLQCATSRKCCACQQNRGFRSLRKRTTNITKSMKIRFIFSTLFSSILAHWFGSFLALFTTFLNENPLRKMGPKNNVIFIGFAPLLGTHYDLMFGPIFY